MPSVGFANYASNFVRRLKTTDPSLEPALARITDSGLVDIPDELFTPVIEESREEHGRKVIMNHLRQCLTDVAKPKAWKRLHAAMILIEELMTNGSAALLAETAVGRHFDVVQKLSFVERFQHTSNERAQSMVRAKAKSLRYSLAEKLREFGANKVGKWADADEDTESTCSPKGSVAGSISSFDSTATPMSQAAKPLYDFDDLMEWAEAECEDSGSDSCVD